VLDGISLGGPSARETDIWNDDNRIKELYTKHPYEFPWSIVDKKFIAAQYKKFGIEELSTLTNSCIISSKSPCKKCWWCKERYWAFGSYDGGIK
jgi:7-cyano-7-deazaguanine synthase in queuosine biosynthesis